MFTILFVFIFVDIFLLPKSFIPRCIRQENTIVNEISFEESASGASQSIGTFVSSNGTLTLIGRSLVKWGGKVLSVSFEIRLHTSSHFPGASGLSASARSMGARGFQGSEESREAKIQKGKRKIQQLASALTLHAHHTDAAVPFLLALSVT